ncbi:hypothetical protein ThimaDRAFT_3495 [Thiocapsa marina 5811]|uniref:Uncharacterized protein n=1 Tax=Thiocapsa marina 5811 TaxID=768671 RepID=F9UEZ2_9GAMM|nr:hypothetical protein ThimaDRAFT_3495 [Thiocapsa marina 5811]
MLAFGRGELLMTCHNDDVGIDVGCGAVRTAPMYLSVQREVLDCFESEIAATGGNLRSPTKMGQGRHLPGRLDVKMPNSALQR